MVAIDLVNTLAVEFGRQYYSDANSDSGSKLGSGANPMEKTKAGARRDLLRAIGGTVTVLAGSAIVPSGHAQAQQASSALSSKPESFFNIRSYGARGNGTDVDTDAFNHTIAAAEAVGGGTVLVPAGNYLCFSIHLASNVTLYLESGAVIIAAENGALGNYDAAESNAPNEEFQDYHHNHWHNSLIWGEGLNNVAIVGNGLFWGRGLSRGDRENRPFAEDPGVGSRIIGLKNCRNVTLSNFAILKGGTMGILATGVDNLVIDGLRIDTNRDGMDIDCCKNVRVSDCSVNSPWDDAICMKSSYALGYARPTENVTITNCYVTGAYELGTMLDGTWKKWSGEQRPPQHGRIKFGTESNGGFLNITVSNCVFEGCRGFALETVDGARLADMTITNIAMRDLIASPFFIRLGARMRGPKDLKIGKLKRVLISNIVVSNNIAAFSSIITGIPGGEIEDIRIRNVFVEHQGGGSREMGAIKLGENEKDYPEHSMFGDTIPAQGFYLRHIKNIEMSDIEIRSKSPDFRPAFILNDVSIADFWHVQANVPAGAAIFALNNVNDFTVSRSKPLQDTKIDRAEDKTLV
jgi:polygalacturonase